MNTATHTPIITFDGPSGSGKGATASAVAQRLGWHLLDSGALYRCLAWHLSQQGDLENLLADKARTNNCLVDMPLRIEAKRYFWNDQEISSVIRTEAVGLAASRIASEPKVREALLWLQRQQAQAPGLVADGRDMGTVVFPEAPYKFFLTASAKARAYRRVQQLQEQGETPSFESVLRDIKLRDKRDAERTIAPLQQAPDAVLINNDRLTLSEVVENVLTSLSPSL